MNYYEHHLGDYAIATAHLSWAEDMAYTRLIRIYYRDEAPIAADERMVCRLVGARTEEEKQAVHDVLHEFFELEEDGWHSKRCDEEIARYRERQAARAVEREAEKERQERHREDRKKLFAELRERGIVLPYDTKTNVLREHLSRVTSHVVTPPVTGDVTANQTPDTSLQTPDSNNPKDSSSGQSPDGAKPAQSKKTPKPKRYHGTDEDHTAARYIFERIRILDATAKEPSWDRWADEIRLMREVDGRTHWEICDLFRWANKDSFWKSNILSPAKLRAQWTQLTLKRAEAPAGHPESKPAFDPRAEINKHRRDGHAAGGHVIDVKAEVVD